MLNSRRKGTTANYETTWKKWVLWCNEQSLDPIIAPLSPVADFLALLFDKGYEYRTIGVYRSAISAYHVPINGVPVGQHPEVSRLMSGIANLKPPMPKYSFTWDVEKVLQLFRFWPTTLTAKQ